MRRQTSWPSMPGSMTSSTTRSGACGRTARRRAGRRGRPRRRSPRRAAARRARRRSPRSSSTMTIVASAVPSTRRMLGRGGARAGCVQIVWRRAQLVCRQVRDGHLACAYAASPRPPPTLDRLPAAGAVRARRDIAVRRRRARGPAVRLGPGGGRGVAARRRLGGRARRLAAAVAHALDAGAAAARHGVRPRARAHEPHLLPRDRPAAARHGGGDRVLRADRRRRARLAHAARRRRARCSRRRA